MFNKKKTKQDIFYELLNPTSYIIDFKKHSYVNCDNPNDTGRLSKLIERYKDKGEAFDRYSIERFFTNIINNVKRVKYFIEFSHETSPVTTRLIYVPTEDRFHSYLFEITNEASLDKLTGLYSANEFESDMDKVRRREIVDPRLTIIAFDLNGLKRINDTYHHTIGDRFIEAAARCISTVFGGCGKCYRNGGDEFFAFVFLTSEELAKKIELFDDTVKNFNVSVGNLSISYGTAAIIDYPDMNIDQLRDQAEENLYNNKREHYRVSGEESRQKEM